MVAPLYEAAGTYLAGGSAASADIVVPAGTAAGKIVLVHLYKENTAAVTPPAGFTECTNSPISTVSSVNSQHIFWKRLTAADAGTYSFSWTGAVWRDGVATLYSGCATTGTPVEINNAAQLSTAGTPTPTVSGTTLGPDRLLVFSGGNINAGILTAPAGFTKRAGGGGSNGLGVCVPATGQAAAGATGSIAGSWDNSGTQTAFLTALIPDSGSASAPGKTRHPGRGPGRGRARFARSQAGFTSFATIDATADAPLGDLVATATAGIDHPATAAAPLGGLAATAAATAEVPATVAAPLGGLAATATAGISHDATAAAPLGALTSTATAVITHDVTVAAPLGGLSATATGARIWDATATAPLGGLSAAATAGLDHPGTATAPLGALNATATAGVSHVVTAAAPLGALTATATGTVTRADATATAALGGLVGAATASPDHPATSTAALGGLTGTATSVVTHPATAAAPLGDLTAAATTTITHNGVATAALGDLVGHAAVQVTVIDATTTTNLGELTATAAGTREATGEADAPLGDLTADTIGDVAHDVEEVFADLGGLTATITGADLTRVAVAAATLGRLYANAAINATGRPADLRAGAVTALLYATAGTVTTRRGPVAATPTQLVGPRADISEAP